MKRKNLKLLTIVWGILLCMGFTGCGKTTADETQKFESQESVTGAETPGNVETSETPTDASDEQETTGGQETVKIAYNGAYASLEGIQIENSQISTNNYKKESFNNPISSEFYCADPTAIEYNGRLYLFGTNDHEQFEIAGADKDNTYEKIKSLVVLSTEDMVNWIYHGEINVGEVAPWITNSWAPSIVSRVEEDGLTHFYLYFSNNGLGVGVITATDPLGPWSDPLGEPLISSQTPGLKNCPNPFDPGVVIDENGDGWLAFGGGKAGGQPNSMPGSSKIVKLGADMLSLDSEICDIPAPYFFEASELNYINGTYVYTYNTDWNDHSVDWNYDCAVPSMCSMVYMTTKTPLDSDSWEMRGEYLKNPGLAGFDYSNNHSHLHKYQDNYYIFYHTMMLKNGMKITGAYRSLNVDEIEVDEENVTIKAIGGSKSGVDAIGTVSAFAENPAASLQGTADISFDTSNMASPIVVSDAAGAWIGVKNVEFTPEAQADAGEQAGEAQTLTAVETIQYNITVSSVDKATTLSMYPSAKGSGDSIGSMAVDGAGSYSITCEIGSAEQMQNMGYFNVDNDAQITLVVDSMVINGSYEFEVAAELTNTRDWANGLKNIWSGITDGEEVYTSSGAVLKYIGADEAIELFLVNATEEKADAQQGALVEFPMVFLGNVKGTGRIEVRLDDPTGELLTWIDFDTQDAYQSIYNEAVAKIGGVHDLYFVFSGEGIEFTSWKFMEREE